MEALYHEPAEAAFKAKDAELYLKSLSSSPQISLQMARAGLAVALLSSYAIAVADMEGRRQSF